MDIKAHNLKQKMLQELYLFLIYTAFFSLVFWSLTTYHRLLLDEVAASHLPSVYLHYSYGLVEAMIIAKTILLGESFGLGERFSHKPLIIPTVYKAALFSILILVFFLLEHFVTGFIKGVSLVTIYQHMAMHGISPTIAKAFVVFVVLIPFFAFVEIAHMFGENKLLKVFFYQGPDKGIGSPSQT